MNSPTLAETVEHGGGDGPPDDRTRLYRDLLLREAMDLSPVGRQVVERVIATVDAQIATAIRILEN